MNEYGKHEVYKEKLGSICEENNLTYSLRVDRYPCTLTIKPLGGMDAQLTMLEADDVSYISPDASIVFAYIDGDLSIKISETFTISDALLSKIKRLFVNLYSTWTQFFFRYIMVHNLIQTEDIPALWGRTRLWTRPTRMPQRPQERMPSTSFSKAKTAMMRSNHTAGGGRRPASLGRM